MALASIRIGPARRPILEADMWLLRAARARRVALMLSNKDAEIALAHAAECEAEAERLMMPRRPPMAA